MPWPMVHFSIAEQLWNQSPSSEFLIGSIAPDAIHMREGTTRQDKGHTHLCDDDGTMPNLSDFDNFYRKHRRSDDHSFNQFMLGYVSHIFTDLRWTEKVWKDYVENEVKQYGKHVVRNLRDTSNEPHIALCYITNQIVAEFIDRTVDELKGLVRFWER